MYTYKMIARKTKHCVLLLNYNGWKKCVPGLLSGISRAPDIECHYFKYVIIGMGIALRGSLSDSEYREAARCFFIYFLFMLLEGGRCMMLVSIGLFTNACSWMFISNCETNG